MKRLFIVLALGLSSTVAAAPAAAQSNVAQRYAACLVKMRPGEVRELLQATSSESADRPYRGLADDDRCFSRVYGGQQFSPDNAGLALDMLRGRLAEQALLSEPAQVAALQPLPLRQQRYIRPWFAATGRHPAVDEMAACMADTDPSGIVALIRTEPGNPDENARGVRAGAEPHQVPVRRHASRRQPPGIARGARGRALPAPEHRALSLASEHTSALALCRALATRVATRCGPCRDDRPAVADLGR